jgi:hypothetical protein
MSDEDRIVTRTIDLFSGIREVREKFLSALSGLQKTRLSMIEGEIKRLRHNTGPKVGEDPRVKMLERKMMEANQMINTINVQLEIAKISVPKVREGEKLVHGCITDENGHGRRNCEVSLVVGGEVLSVLGKTDDSGYYSIILPASVVKRIGEQDFDIYVRRKGFLVHKSANSIKLTGQENKYEAVLNKSELEDTDMPEKAKRESHRGSKRK